MTKALFLILAATLLSCAGKEKAAKENPVWPELVKRVQAYRETNAWPSHWERTWEEDVALLKGYALGGKREAFHQLFLLSTTTDGFMVETYGEVLLALREKQTKLFESELKQESPKIREMVLFHLGVSGGEPVD